MVEEIFLDIIYICPVFNGVRLVRSFYLKLGKYLAETYFVCCVEQLYFEVSVLSNFVFCTLSLQQAIKTTITPISIGS